MSDKPYSIQCQDGLHSLYTSLESMNMFFAFYRNDQSIENNTIKNHESQTHLATFTANDLPYVRGVVNDFHEKSIYYFATARHFQDIVYGGLDVLDSSKPNKKTLNEFAEKLSLNVRNLNTSLISLSTFSYDPELSNLISRTNKSVKRIEHISTEEEIKSNIEEIITNFGKIGHKILPYSSNNQFHSYIDSTVDYIGHIHTLKGNLEELDDVIDEFQLDFSDGFPAIISISHFEMTNLPYIIGCDEEN